MKTLKNKKFSISINFFIIFFLDYFFMFVIRNHPKNVLACKLIKLVPKKTKLPSFDVFKSLFKTTISKFDIELLDILDCYV